MRAAILVGLILCVSCGSDSDGGGGGSAGTAGNAGTAGSGAAGGTAGSGGTAGNAGTAGSGATAGSAGTAGTAGAGGSGEPCDYLNPEVVALDTPITRDLPSGSCSLHYYRFIPPTTGVYTITKSGSGNLGFCDPGFDDGCICGVNINCCASCTLTYDLAAGGPLTAGSNNPIYIDPLGASGTYTFTVTGPN